MPQTRSSARSATSMCQEPQDSLPLHARHVQAGCPAASSVTTSAVSGSCGLGTPASKWKSTCVALMSRARVVKSVSASSHGRKHRSLARTSLYTAVYPSLKNRSQSKANGSNGTYPANSVTSQSVTTRPRSLSRCSAKCSPRSGIASINNCVKMKIRMRKPAMSGGANMPCSPQLIIMAANTQNVGSSSPACHNKWEAIALIPCTYPTESWR
mmetsp:Transcript_65565/g.170689  ORF Transcript_65565/g.170689 Transcript_65565/m.170689 type:complete len:212 (+) Transcript_65565:299-934(+)